MAEPPAESPSTIYISDSAGSFSWQSANFPGKPATSKTPFLLVISLAFLAASLAKAASDIFVKIDIASFGFSKRYSLKFLLKTLLTTLSTSEETSFSFVCDENLGSGIFTETIAVKPSLTSSPSSSIGDFLFNSSFLINVFITLVKLDRNPERCVPPSF